MDLPSARCFVWQSPGPVNTKTDSEETGVRRNLTLKLPNSVCRRPLGHVFRTLRSKDCLSWSVKAPVCFSGRNASTKENIGCQRRRGHLLGADGSCSAFTVLCLGVLDEIQFGFESCSCSFKGTIGIQGRRGPAAVRATQLGIPPASFH